MSFYVTNFLTLGIACGFLFFRQRSIDGGRDDANQVVGGNSGTGAAKLKTANSRFTRLYLIVYALTMGADWLQVWSIFLLHLKYQGTTGLTTIYSRITVKGPHIYALYHDQMGFSEETVARFFAVGFISGAVSAYFVGNLADRSVMNSATWWHKLSHHRTD